MEELYFKWRRVFAGLDSLAVLGDCFAKHVAGMCEYHHQRLLTKLWALTYSYVAQNRVSITCSLAAINDPEAFLPTDENSWMRTVQTALSSALVASNQVHRSVGPSSVCVFNKIAPNLFPLNEVFYHIMTRRTLS
jgi:hypothetical protein